MFVTLGRRASWAPLAHSLGCEWFRAALALLWGAGAPCRHTGGKCCLCHEGLLAMSACPEGTGTQGARGQRFPSHRLPGAGGRCSPRLLQQRASGCCFSATLSSEIPTAAERNHSRINTGQLSRQGAASARSGDTAPVQIPVWNLNSQRLVHKCVWQLLVRLFLQYGLTSVLSCPQTCALQWREIWGKYKRFLWIPKQRIVLFAGIPEADQNLWYTLSTQALIKHRLSLACQDQNGDRISMISISLNWWPPGAAVKCVWEALEHRQPSAVPSSKEHLALCPTAEVCSSSSHSSVCNTNCFEVILLEPFHCHHTTCPFTESLKSSNTGYLNTALKV